MAEEADVTPNSFNREMLPDNKETKANPGSLGTGGQRARSPDSLAGEQSTDFSWYFSNFIDPER